MSLVDLAQSACTRLRRAELTVLRRARSASRNRPSGRPSVSVVGYGSSKMSSTRCRRLLRVALPLAARPKVGSKINNANVRDACRMSRPSVLRCAYDPYLQDRIISDPNVPLIKNRVGMRRFLIVAMIGSTVAWLPFAMRSRRSDRRVFRSPGGD